MIYVFLANGFEEMEAMAPVDCLRRAGLDVKTVAVGGDAIRSSHGVIFIPDMHEYEMTLDESLQMIVLPGGMPGTLNLEASKAVQNAIAYCTEHAIPIGAICAAPSILGHLGLLKGRHATCYEGFEEQLTGAILEPGPVCVDGKIITARGAGVSLAFGLQLVATLINQDRADRMAESLMC